MSSLQQARWWALATIIGAGAAYIVWQRQRQRQAAGKKPGAKYVTHVDKDKRRQEVNELEARYSKEAAPQIEFLEGQREAWGDSYPDAAFLPPLKGDAATRERIWAAMRDLWVFWKDVQQAYKDGILDDDFFTRSWAGRGKQYRLLVEPVDIANWYRKNKQIDSGHYIDGLEENELADNRKRPGRYILLQKQEARVFGADNPDYKVESSLGKARQFKQLFGQKEWKECLDVIKAAAGDEEFSRQAHAAAALAVAGAEDGDKPAWPWFREHFASTSNKAELYSDGVRWESFWYELKELINSPENALGKVQCAYSDHALFRNDQRKKFQKELAKRVRLRKANEGVSALEFDTAVKSFSPGEGRRVGLCDLIHSVMLGQPGAKYDPGNGLREYAFLSHTGADKGIGSVPIVEALFTELHKVRNVPAFYDAYSIEPSTSWRDVIVRRARGSRVFVAVLSPNYFKRYWCLVELEKAVHGGGKPVIIPVLLGVGHDVDKQVQGFRGEWERFSQLDSMSEAERNEKLMLWQTAVQAVSRCTHAVDASNYGLTGKSESYTKGQESRLAEGVAKLVVSHIAGDPQLR